MTARPDFEVPVWLGKAEFLEKDLGEFRLIVLSRVNQDRGLASGEKGLDYGRSFDEVRPGTDYVKLSWHPGRLGTVSAV